MPTYETNAGRDCVDVHNRLDKIVLAVRQQDGGRAQTELTAADARRIAQLLQDAADNGERTPGG